MRTDGFRAVAGSCAEEAAGQPEAVQKALTLFLAQVPGAIRQSQRCPADPGGCSLLPSLSLAKSDDVLQVADHAARARLRRRAEHLAERGEHE